GTTDVFGSPLYMSPEQLRASRHVDARADIWALGVVLFELLTARVPFGGETAAVPEVHAAILAEPTPSLRAIRPDVPKELEHIVAKCLAKDPHERFSSIKALADALAPFRSLSRARNVPQRAVRPRLVIADSSAPGPGGARANAATNAAWDSSA